MRRDWLARPGQPLLEHLYAVGDMTGQLAVLAGLGDEGRDQGRAAGGMHDSGKAADLFLDGRLKGLKVKYNHAAAGAAWAQQHGARDLAFWIAGHHVGLADAGSFEVDPAAFALVRDEIPADLLVCPTRRPAWAHGLRRDLYVRVMFSALCDSDSTDARNHEARQRSAPIIDLADERSYPQIFRTCLDRLRRYIAGLAVSPMSAIRAEVLAACVAAASMPRGVFDLTGPTGGGKTLAYTWFGLAHLIKYGGRRLIIVCPRTTLIEQVARVLRAAVGDEFVVEHHSRCDYEKQQYLRHTVENWFAPIIVTTDVQFFDSWHSNRPTVMYKLHRTAGAVIVFDELWTSAPGILDPIRTTLYGLVAHLGTTVVFSAATPTGLDIGLPAYKIIPDPIDLFKRVPRNVQVDWRLSPTTFDAIASDMLTHQQQQVLCVVDRRADAQTLYRQVKAATGADATFHLSGTMCAAHRTVVLDRVRERLAAKLPCYLLATQVVEAGVDIDFPVVYRALAPIPNIMQTEGRCNRNGHFDEVGGGLLIVFKSPSDPPLGLLKGCEITETLLREHDGALDLRDPELSLRYFAKRDKGCLTDEHGIESLRLALAFVTINEKFATIPDDKYKEVVVPWGDRARRAIAAFRKSPSRQSRRALGRFTIEVPVRRHVELERSGVFVPAKKTIWVIDQTRLAEFYADDVGFIHG